MNFRLHPRLEQDSHLIGHMELCQIRLINDCQYPWFILIPQRDDIKEIYQLSDIDQKKLWKESQQLSVAIMNIFHGDKLNVAAIGNLVPQLHIHHVVRYIDDPCWPDTVWGRLPMQEYEKTSVIEIQRKIARKLNWFVSEPI